MEIKYETIFEVYKERLNSKENECVMWQAQAITLQEKVAELEGLLKENNIEIAKEM